MEISFERNIGSRGWHVYGKTVWQNPRRGEKLEAEMQLLGKSKERINFFLLLLGISQERFRGLQNSFYTTVKELKRRLFFYNTNHSKSHQ